MLTPPNNYIYFSMGFYLFLLFYIRAFTVYILNLEFKHLRGCQCVIEDLFCESLYVNAPFSKHFGA